jgi:hypothetical protein
MLRATSGYRAAERPIDEDEHDARDYHPSRQHERELGDLSSVTYGPSRSDHIATAPVRSRAELLRADGGLRSWLSSGVRLFATYRRAYVSLGGGDGQSLLG